jgi:hypothetical protein
MQKSEAASSLKGRKRKRTNSVCLTEKGSSDEEVISLKRWNGNKRATWIYETGKERSKWPTDTQPVAGSASSVEVPA